MVTASASCRFCAFRPSVLSQLVAQLFDQAPAVIDLHPLGLCGEGGPDVLELPPLADLEGLAQDFDLAAGGDQPDEGELPSRNRELAGIHREIGGQLAQALAPSVLGWRLVPELRMDM